MCQNVVLKVKKHQLEDRGWINDAERSSGYLALTRGVTSIEAEEAVACSLFADVLNNWASGSEPT